MVDEKTTINSPSPSPKIYDLRTPSKRTNYTEIALSSESSTKSDTAKGFEKTDKIPITSNLDTTSTVQKTKTTQSRELSLVDQLLMEDQTRSKWSKVGESYCYKTFQ